MSTVLDLRVSLDKLKQAVESEKRLVIDGRKKHDAVRAQQDALEKQKAALEKQIASQEQGIQQMQERLRLMEYQIRSAAAAEKLIYNQ